MSILQFSPISDFETIPYQPLNIGEPAELRFQIKNPTDKLLQGEARLLHANDSDKVLWSCNDIAFQPGGFFFQKLSVSFPEGRHLLKLQWKTEEESCFEEVEIEIAATGRHEPLLSGAFVVLQDYQKEEMTEEKWAQIADSANAIGIKMLIIFMTLSRVSCDSTEVHTFYPSKVYPQNEKTVGAIDAIMGAAERNGQEVMIGLGEPLVRTLANINVVMEELYELYGHYKSFYGWYSSCEINMAGPDDEKNWVDWNRVRESADKLSPVRPVMTSPYLDNCRNTADMDPKFLEKIRNGYAGFDILMPQDMVGHVLTQGCNGGRLTPAESGRMYALLKPACDEGSVHLWANCEAFDFDATETFLVPRYVNGGLFGELGYLQQLKEAAPHTQKVLTYKFTMMFSAPGQSPCLCGQAAVEQYENYRKYREETLEAQRQNEVK